MFFPLWQERVGETYRKTKAVERPRLVSIVPLLAAATQTQNSNVLYRRFALLAREVVNLAELVETSWLFVELTVS
jgi:hypothetical protein